MQNFMQKTQKNNLIITVAHISYYYHARKSFCMLQAFACFCHLQHFGYVFILKNAAF